MNSVLTNNDKEIYTECKISTDEYLKMTHQ